jgi:NUMOD3 motif
MTEHDPPAYRRMSPTPKTRRKISRALKGRPHSVARRRKMRAARRRYLARIKMEAVE